MNDLVREYVAKIMGRLRAVPVATQAATEDPRVLADEVFTILTGREFCYLSRTRTAPYRESAVGLLAGCARDGQPLRFYYDIGPGYHARVHPEETGLSFNVGFSELCVLAQISSFANRVAALYPPGAKFSLVIDNVCGLLTNDIPLEDSTAYCARLRQLIEQTGVGERVDVLVESEEFPLSEYEIDRTRLAQDAAATIPSPEDLENVERFLGRPCDRTEAVERIAKYRQAGELTERMLARIVRGVRMTQRATGGTLGFRPFPGGDSRTQVGEVAISPNAGGVLRPILLTSRNVGRYRCSRLPFPDLLPPVIGHVTYAVPVDAGAPSV